MFCRVSVLKIYRHIPRHQIKRFLRSFTVEKNSWLNHRKRHILNSSEISKNSRCFLHDSIDDVDYNDEIDHEGNLLPYNITTAEQYFVRNLLYPDSDDCLMVNLKNCVSMQEVFDIISSHGSEMKHKHVTQAILVLWDLQKMILFTNSLDILAPKSNTKMQDYTSQLLKKQEFIKLTELVKENCNEFDEEELSCLLLYLNKMGLDMKTEVLQSLMMRLRNSIKPDISLTALSRFMVAIYSEANLGNYFLIQDMIPIIIERLEKCTCVEELKLITICLNHFQHLINDDVLELYVNKVGEFLESEKLNSENYKAILKVAVFLNFGRWNNKTAALKSRVLLLLKNKIHLLNLHEFFDLFEIVYNNQEPGELLTELQRCASRFLHHLEEDGTISSALKLKLLTCITYFSSPVNRHEYIKIIEKSIKEPLNLHSMFDLLRLMTFSKTTDVKLCDFFWNNMLTIIETEKLYLDDEILLKLCQKYMNYCNDTQYNNKKFENQMMTWLEKHISDGIVFLIPWKLSLAASFILPYSNNDKLINETVEKLVENWEQIYHLNCLFISKGIGMSSDLTKNPYLKPSLIRKLHETLDRSAIRSLAVSTDVVELNFLLKSCMYRKRLDTNLIENVLISFKSRNILSSNTTRILTHTLRKTGSFLPDIMENLIEYVIRYKDNLLAFNAEKVAYLCYYLGYRPKKSSEFFQSITDIIIRDQERISGLSYIQAALSLAFFYKLPDSLIKHIFNVEFLEKLDNELACCYFKDVYPHRVRFGMMELNRAVCLDYPQSNVPWFHKKYCEQLASHPSNYKEFSEIKEHLVKLFGSPDRLLQNVVGPYGYYIDFEICLDKNGQMLNSSSEEVITKIAVLLMKPYAYTQINVQLKGHHQLKKRHLEILGYDVAMIDLTKWNSLLYGEEKLEYLNKLLKLDSYVRKSHLIVER